MIRPPRQMQVTVLTLCLALAGSLALVPGCADKPKKTNVVKNTTPKTIVYTRPRPNDGLKVAGLRGTIDFNSVKAAFAKKMGELGRCQRQHLDSRKYVGGELAFFFKIGMDGVPKIVRLNKSTMGNHEMESCVLAIARSLRFAKPEGGHAEVDYSLSLPSGGIPTEDWEQSKVEPAIKKKRAELAACQVSGKPSKFTITFYIFPGGEVKSVGVSSKSDPLPDSFGGCIAQVLTKTTFPDPLGKVAKATYSY